MSFWQKALLKSTVILRAALALALFVCVTYAASFAFFYLKIDRDIYRGAFNFVTCLLVFVLMFVFHKLGSIGSEPLIKLKKLGPDQVAATVIIGLGMLGFVATYLGVTEMFAESRETVNEAVEEYRESVDRFADVPQVVIPVWDTILYVFTLCFLVPVTEEMTFRGVIYGQLRQGFGPLLTVILTSLTFGLLHGVSIHVGYALVCGLIIAFCYHLTDSLAAPVILHMVFNIFGSGIPTLMSVEYFGIPDDVTKSFMAGVNTTSILFMPVSVLAFAYLISVKRKKAKQAAEAAVTVETPAEVQETDSLDDAQTKENVSAADNDGGSETVS
ncbi:MAG: CPBP family intramembrane metalloprotease [Clostridiales bacterium]|nr:CPBP family intramembrane metalloprotease [Clostridiales bacterium]